MAAIAMQEGWITTQQQMERLNRPNELVVAEITGTAERPGALPVHAVASIVAAYAADLDPNLFKWEEALRYFEMLPDKMPPLSKSLRAELDMVCPLRGHEEKEDGTHYKKRDTHSLYLRPPGTLNEFVSRAGAYGQEHLSEYGGSNPFRFSYCAGETLREHGETRFDEPRWMLISNALLMESRHQPYERLVQIVEDLSERAGTSYEVPSLYSVVAFVFFENVTTRGCVLPGINELNPKRRIYTRVKETVDGQHLAVGGSGRNGLGVYTQFDHPNTVGTLAVKES